MITPAPAAAMIRAARCEQRKWPVRFTSMMRRHQASSASKKWSMGLTMPALLTSTSTVPKASSVASNMAATWPLSDTSATAPMAVPPASVMAATAVSTRSGSMSLTVTWAPAPANRSAIACPMPLPAPVTTTT